MDCKMIAVEYNDLVLLYDSWINYQAMLRVFNEEEDFDSAIRTIIKANWNNVPEEYEKNSVACAEHIIEEIYNAKSY